MHALARSELGSAGAQYCLISLETFLKFNQNDAGPTYLLQKLNDLSRSLAPLEPDGTLIAVIEMSQSSWLVAGIVPGVERQPLKKLAADEIAIAKATAPMARGSRESRTQDRTHCSRLRGWPGWFLAGALVEDTQH